MQRFLEGPRREAGGADQRRVRRRRPAGHGAGEDPALRRLRVRRGDVRGTLVLRTQAGDICVTAAPGVPAALDAGTSHGRVSNALKNDGTAALDIRATTSHGDIVARSL